jgi:hypothetical protein
MSLDDGVNVAALNAWRDPGQHYREESDAGAAAARP